MSNQSELLKSFAQANAMDFFGDNAEIGFDYHDEDEANSFADKVADSTFFAANVSDTSFESNEDEEQGEGAWIVVTVTTATEVLEERGATQESLQADYDKFIK